jgi:hypothetical protein
MEASGMTIEQQLEILWDVLQDYRENSISQDDEAWQSICGAMSQLTEAAFSGETDPEEAFMQGEI